MNDYKKEFIDLLKKTDRQGVDEVIENLESIHGALLRMNRSIQAEGTFGIIKNNRNYKRIVRKGIKSVKLEALNTYSKYNEFELDN